jgi:hypothetical protein
MVVGSHDATVANNKRAVHSVGRSGAHDDDDDPRARGRVVVVATGGRKHCIDDRPLFVAAASTTSACPSPLSILESIIGLTVVNSRRSVCSKRSNGNYEYRANEMEEQSRCVDCRGQAIKVVRPPNVSQSQAVAVSSLSFCFR